MTVIDEMLPAKSQSSTPRTEARSGAETMTGSLLQPATSRIRGSLPSLRLRLTLGNVAVLAGALLLFSVSLYAFLAMSLDHNLNESLIQQYGDVRENFNAYASIEDGVLTVKSNLQPNAFSSQDNMYVQVARLDGTVPDDGRSANLGQNYLPRPPELLARIHADKVDLRDIQLNDQPLRLYSGPAYFSPNRVTREVVIVGVIQVARPLGPIESQLELLRILMIGIGVTSLLVAGVIGMIISGAALRPLDRLAHAARAIGASRDFSRRVSEHGAHDEVGQLAQTINEMLTQLQAAHNGLATSLEVQRRFVADASHELRTPLTTIRGNVGLLRRNADVAPTDRQAALADIESEAERMSRLVSQLLSLARADAGQTLTMAAVDLDATVQEVGRQLVLLAQERGLTANLGPIEPSRVLGNADALKQLLLILVDNAIKYTPAPGQVSLSLRHQGQMAIVTMSDSGIGIDPEKLPHIFERFYRADPARTGSGAGLGLAIALWLAEAHQARLEVNSTPGRGTTFWLRLSLAF